MAFCKIMSLVNMFTSSPAMARECPWGAPRLEECRRVTICSVSMARFIGTR